ncbi:MAG: O-antigen ligase family protein [Nitrosomonadales bacterium]
MLAFEFKQERLAEITLANIWPFILTFASVMFAMRMFSQLAFVIAIFVLVAALSRQITVSYYALLIVPCLNVMNWALFHATFNYNLASKALTLLLCVILIQQAASVRERYNVLRPFGWLIGYVAMMLVLSPFSMAPLISVLKGVLFLSFLGALIAMVTVMLHGQIHPGRARSVVLAICCIFIFGSIAVYPLPSISRSMLYMRSDPGVTNLINDTYGLYNGVVYHSQTLGPLLAVLNAFLLSDYLFNLQRGGKLHQMLLCCIPILVYLTSSRTALLTYLGSIFVVWLLLSRSRRVPAGRKQFMNSLCAAGFLLATAGLLVSSGFRSSAVAFLEKNREGNIEKRTAGEIAESLTASRMGIVNQQMESFRKHPFIGTGFQVSEELGLRGTRTLADLLSAPVEKGVLPTMILEEGGLLGALVMVCFLVSVVQTFLKRHCYCFLGTFSAFLLTNMGEAIFFSPSGGGGIIWTICFCALLLDLHRIRYDQIRSRPMEAMGTQANWTFR